MKEPIQKETDNNITQNIAIAKEYMKKLQSYFVQPQRDNKN